MPKPRRRFSILLCNSEDVANQITLLMSEKYVNVRPEEFHHAAFAKSDGARHSPRLRDFIAFTNKVILLLFFCNCLTWIDFFLGFHRDFKNRGCCSYCKGSLPLHYDWKSGVLYLINSSLFFKCFEEKNNFSGLMSLLSSLHSSAISKLKLAWSVRIPHLFIFLIHPLAFEQGNK